MNNLNIKSGKTPRRIGRWLQLTIAVFIATFGTWLFLNRQFIVDWAAVQQFQASTEISALVAGSGMSKQGEFLYLASKPQLDERSDFNKNCAMRESQSIVLGCYVGGRIYIFNVTDERIDGIRNVVAAHEMLHAVYERLSNSEREKLDKLLSDQLEKTTDQDILELVKIYDKTEPGQRWNELHSIFATEVRNLSNELETHYRKYFVDRDKTLTSYEKYRQVFADLEKRAEILQGELATKKAEIARRTADYEAEISDLPADVNTFNKKAATTGAFASEAEFQAAREDLIGRQNALDALADSINNLVDNYNQGVSELGVLGIEIDKLNQNLNSQSEKID